MENGWLLNEISARWHLEKLLVIVVCVARWRGAVARAPMNNSAKMVAVGGLATIVIE